MSRAALRAVLEKHASFAGGLAVPRAANRMKTSAVFEKLASLKLATRVINADVGLDQIINHMKAARAKKQAAISAVLTRI